MGELGCPHVDVDVLARLEAASSHVESEVLNAK